MFYFHTPYYGSDELFLDAEERAPVIERLQALHPRGAARAQLACGPARAPDREVGAPHAGGSGGGRRRRVGVLPSARRVLRGVRLRRMHRDRRGAAPAAQRGAGDGEVLVSTPGDRNLASGDASDEAPLGGAGAALGLRAPRPRVGAASSRAHIALPARSLLPKRLPVLSVHEGAVQGRADRALHARCARRGRPVGGRRRPCRGHERLRGRRHAHPRARRGLGGARPHARALPADGRRVHRDQPRRRGRSHRRAAARRRGRARLARACSPSAPRA